MGLPPKAPDVIGPPPKPRSIPLASLPLAADLKAGIFTARAAGEGALTCIKANLDSLKDDPRVPELLKQLAPYEERLRRD